MEEVIPYFGIPEALSTDRGTNLLSHLMKDLAYHPQCDGTVKRFNRTLKTALRKHAACFGSQWDQHLPGILWAYRNTPYSSTREKPSFLTYGIDCHSTTEAAYLPALEMIPVDVHDYLEELMISLTSARDLAAEAISRAQAQCKYQYDKNVRQKDFKIGDWILVRFPQDETGQWRKLSRPWHGPHQVVGPTSTAVTCVKVYYPQEGELHIHQTRVCECPKQFSAGFYWYGGRRKGPGHPPKSVDHLLRRGRTSVPSTNLMGPTETREIEDAESSTTRYEGQTSTEVSLVNPAETADSVPHVEGTVYGECQELQRDSQEEVTPTLTRK